MGSGARELGGKADSSQAHPASPQHCTCVDDCSSSNCLCGQLSIRCWYDKVRTLTLSLTSYPGAAGRGQGRPGIPGMLIGQMGLA